MSGTTTEFGTGNQNPSLLNGEESTLLLYVSYIRKFQRGEKRDSILVGRAFPGFTRETLKGEVSGIVISV